MKIMRQIIASSEAAIAAPFQSRPSSQSNLLSVAPSLEWVGALPAAPRYLNRFIYMLITTLIGRKSPQRYELCCSRLT